MPPFSCGDGSLAGQLSFSFPRHQQFPQADSSPGRRGKRWAACRALLQFHPQGARFRVQGSQVTSSLWTFSFGHGAFSGPRISYIQFQGERLAYEISLQEVLVSMVGIPQSQW